MTLEIASTSLENTLSIAAKVGENVRGGEVIELISDVGGGKTAFVKGLARGMGSSDQVASPTFTVSRHYRGRAVELHHYDFYRLNDPGIIEQQLEESIHNPGCAVAIEWSNIVEEVLPEDRLCIEIASTGEHSRLFGLHAGSEHEHLLKGIA